MHINHFRYLLSRKTSYAQHGEDMLLVSFFNYKRGGFYIDVGAHHPFRFSNTYLFYKMGWSGINIDAKPGTKELFDFFRPRDINLETGIAQQNGSMTYYMFDEPALNGFSKELSFGRDKQTSYKITGSTDIPVQRLDGILETHLRAETPIDFLTVDVEGLDLEVLSSNNWLKFRPKMVVAEDVNLDVEKLSDSGIYNFLRSKDYVMVGKTLTSLIFKDPR
ncbi:FkbM family methyltransferase [Dyadobacter sandarakinus]|uniref:FkbM family methyltransferase n=1 Tax=Dyadobacter sandarakinus TaxID=2747268 RepID=A0ABX7ID71_9BACT|nr:FkbM family methyltransferase [Dyadobacter sandarakinus]QRR03402.1 FkbM family methyltransferase [Dyadobacter sandarakinus]